MKLGEDAGVRRRRELEADESGPRSGKNGCLAPDDQDVVYVGPGAGRAAANASAAARRAQTFTRAAPAAARAAGGFSCGRFRSAARSSAAGSARRSDERLALTELYRSGGCPLVRVDALDVLQS